LNSTLSGTKPPTHIHELTSIEVPDGTPAGWEPPTANIQPAVDRFGPASTGQPARESCSPIGGAEVDHPTLLVDEDRRGQMRRRVQDQRVRGVDLHHNELGGAGRPSGMVSPTSRLRNSAGSR
jgi:hypothetical protein